jgi:hypothetical protein
MAVLFARQTLGASNRQTIYPLSDSKTLGKGIGKANPLKHRPIAKTLAEHNRNLIQPGSGPNLRVPKVELMIL